jgi:uncharacterized protein
MTQLVIRHPRAIIAAVFVLTVIAALGLRRGLTLDVSPLGFVERHSTAQADFMATLRQFGADDYLVVAVVADDIFALANLARLRALHKGIAQTKGVAEVLSLINVPYARSADGVVTAQQLIPELATDEQAQLVEARRVATTDRLFAGNLVASDGRTAAFNILLQADLPTPLRHVVMRQLYELTRQAGFQASYFAGDPFSQWRATEALKSDLRLFLPLTLLLIASLLWLSFRSLVAVMLPLVTIGLGLLWLLGLMAYTKARFTVLALMLPTLMLAIGCSYLIHVLNQIGIVSAACEAQGRGSGETARPISSQMIIASAMGFINLPVIVSALTIIAGFLSLAFTPIPAIRTTAIYAALGAAFTMLLSLTFVPAVLVLLPPYALKLRVGLMGGMVKLLAATGRWATAQQTLLYILTAIIVIVSLLGLRRIKIDIDYFHFFKPQSETSRGLAEINERLSGAVTFALIVTGDSAGALERTDVLRRIEQLQAFAEQQKDASGQGIDRTLSVVDFAKHLNRAFHDNEAQHYALPSDEEVLQELLAHRAQLRGFFTSDGRTARILVRSNLSGSQAMAGVIRTVEQRGRELLPEFRVFATGTLVLLNRTSDQIAGEQVQSISIALLTIFAMLALLFRSLRVGLTALVPNLIPVLFFFGFMGWRGIPLNLTTSLVASVVLGLAVDNAVQFIVRFRRLQSQTDDLRAAIIESMRLSGRPIIYANIALAVTFAVFAASNFEPISSFGLLSAVTIVGCLIEDLVLLPARLTSPVFRAK